MQVDPVALIEVVMSADNFAVAGRPETFIREAKPDAVFAIQDGIAIDEVDLIGGLKRVAVFKQDPAAAARGDIDVVQTGEFAVDQPDAIARLALVGLVSVKPNSHDAGIGSVVQRKQILISVVPLNKHRAVDGSIAKPASARAKPMYFSASYQVPHQEAISTRKVERAPVLSRIDRTLKGDGVVCDAVAYGTVIQRGAKACSGNVALKENAADQNAASDNGGKGQTSQHGRGLRTANRRSIVALRPSADGA